MTTKTLRAPIDDGKEIRGHVCTCAGCGSRGIYCDTDHGIIGDDGSEVRMDFGSELVSLLAGRADGTDTDSLYCSECA